jgi:hypothetical protein
MFPSTGLAALTEDGLILPLFFARQPEPDLEFTEEDLDETAPPPPPMRAPKRSGKKPLMWVVILLIMGGLGYAAYDPESVMQMLEPYFGNGTEQAAPERAMQTPPSATQQPQVGTKPPSTAAQPPSVSDSSSAATSAPAAPPPTGAAPLSLNTPPTSHIGGPLYSEGQRVTAVAHPARPTAPVPLFTDAVGTKIAMTVPASATLIIVDGDLQQSGWMYAVRTENGRQGWIAERNLKLKR